MKITGFTRQKHKLQIFSYAIYILDITIFYIGIIPLSNNNYKIIGSIIHIILCIGTLISAYITTSIDPSDQQILIKNIHSISTKDKLITANFCKICNAYVQINSYHCHHCNRCVENFDHHCTWVNNCVGSKNYTPFIFMIVNAGLQMGSYLVFSMILTSQYIRDNTLKDNMILLYANDQITIIMILIWCFNIIVLILLFFDLNLILLHIYLKRRKLTTWKFIMLRKEERDAIKQFRFLGLKKDGSKIRDKVCCEMILFIKKRNKNANKEQVMSISTHNLKDNQQSVENMTSPKHNLPKNNIKLVPTFNKANDICQNYAIKLQNITLEMDPKLIEVVKTTDATPKADLLDGSPKEKLTNS